MTARSFARLLTIPALVIALASPFSRVAYAAEEAVPGATDTQTGSTQTTTTEAPTLQTTTGDPTPQTTTGDPTPQTTTMTTGDPAPQTTTTTGDPTPQTTTMTTGDPAPQTTITTTGDPTPQITTTTDPDPLLTSGNTQSLQQSSISGSGTESTQEENHDGAGDTGSNGGTVTIEGMVVEEVVGSGVVLDIPGLTNKVFESDGKTNVLQKAIDTALSQVKQDLQATVIISIGNGVYSDDITIAENDQIDMLASKLVLVSAEAFSIDANSNYPVYAEEPAGGVKLNGNMTVDSLDVLLYGLYLSTQKKVKVTDAELTVVGTTEDDAVNIEVSSSEGERFGLDVQTGGGNDTVTITQTGERYSTNAEDRPMQIRVDTGAGADRIDVTLGGLQTVEANLTGGAGNDAIALAVASEAANSVKKVTIRDTEGNNTVTAAFKKNRTDLAIITGAGSDTVTVSGEKNAKDGSLSVETGAGNDVIKLDVSVADALRRMLSTPGPESAGVRIDAGAGVDTLHLSGSLSTKEKGSDRITGDAQSIILVNSSDKRLTLLLSGTVEHFVDDLKNKETVKIEGVDSEGYACTKNADNSLVRIAPKSFITYYYSATDIPTLIMQRPQGKAIFCILTIAAADKCKLGNVLAPGLALLVSAKDITVSGEVFADSILLSAEANDETFQNSKIKGTNLPVEGSKDFPEQLQGVSLSFFEIKGAANIHILPTAYLHVSNPVGTVTLNTLVSYTHMLLDITDVSAGLNFANVKLCSSIIDIAGRIEAYAVKALAKAVVTLTASNSLASLLFVPVAVSVGFAEAGVRVHGTPGSGSANVKATNEATLLADSALTLTTAAGTGRLPITFAVSVADNTVYSKVYENAVVESGGDITIEATGTTSVKTTAQKGEKDASNSGGFFAVAVVTQDVRAGVYDNASVRAVGKLHIHTVAKEKVVTLATSARPKTDDNMQAEMSLDFLLKFGKSLLSTLGKFFTAEALDKLTKAKKQIEGSDHAITMEATQNGSAAVSAAKANENDTITITVSPDKAYKLKAITVRYLKPGEKTYTELTPTKATNATYTFTMPKAEVKIAVTFEKDPTGQGGDNGGGTKGSGGNSIKDIVDKASNSGSDANRAVTSEPASNTKAKTVSVDDDNIKNGAVLIDIAKRSGEEVIRVLPNKQVKVACNPSAHYTIDTLKATYTSPDGKAHEIIISENLNGEFVFNMPDANVRILATFKEGTAEKKSSSSTQLTGALAVSVANNGSEALIDTTGSVTSGGETDVKATADTGVENTADATPNGSKEDPPVEGDPDDEIVAGRNVGDGIVVAEMRNGASVTPEGPTGDNKLYAFTFTARLGYEIKTVKCTYKNCAGETKSFDLPTDGDSKVKFLYEFGKEYDGTGGKVWVKPKYDIAYGEKYTIVATFQRIGNGETVLCVATNGGATVQIAEGEGESLRYRAGSKAKQNDKVVFALKPAEGYTPGAASAVSVKFTTANGTEEEWTVANKKLSVSDDGKIFGFVMPNAVVTIHAVFTAKANPISVTLANANELKEDGKPEDPKTEYLAISDSKFVAVGERFTIGLTDAAVLRGLRIDIGTVTVTQRFSGGTEIHLVPEFHLRDKLIIEKISNQDHGDETFTLLVSLRLVNGACAVTYEKDTTANTVTVPKYADAGDTITLTPKPADNFKLTTGSLTVTVKMASGNTVTGAAVKGRDGKYTFTIPKGKTGEIVQEVAVKAGFEQSPGSKAAKKISVGVGVAVTVLTHSAVGEVKNGRLDVKGLSVAAESVTNSAAVAKAGFSEGDIGVAGSVAINIASARTSAALQAAPVVKLGSGALTVQATSQGKLDTNADSSGGKMKTGVGVGAAIAVGVFTTDVKASIAANAQLLQQGDDPLNSISVRATQSITESMQTKAGASGGTAVTPVLSLLLSETNADAEIGAVATGVTGMLPLAVAGDVTVQAENIVKRTVAANASAAGGNVGVGAAFTVTYIKDRARARLSRSVRTDKNVGVTAKGIFTMKGTSRAGANGSKSRKTASDDASSEGGGEADQQAQKGISSVKGLQGKSNNTTETGKQKAETSEGSISVAAAFILNLQSAVVESVIDGGVLVVAPNGTVTVGSTAQIDSRFNASGSATVAKIGVGVAVALNVVTYTNIAHIDDACILAKDLSVTATVPAANEKKDEAEKPDPNNYILVFVKGLVRKFLTMLAEDTALRAIKGALTSDDVVNTITRIILGENNANLRALLNGTGLEKILDANPVETFLQNWDACFKDIKAILKHADYEALKELVVDEVKAQVAPLLLKFAFSAIGAFKDGFKEDGFTGALKDVCGLIVNKAKKFFGDAKDPAYWANTMSDLFIDASKKLLNGVADLAQTKKFITDNFKGKVVENLKSYLSHIGMALTNEALDRLSALGNLTIKAEDPVPAHVFYTYAIAGAGAFDVGIAGSAAVAWVTGTTLAYVAPVSIADAEKYRVTVTGNTLVRAESVHRMETIASSAVGSNDEPDKHESAVGDGDDSGTATSYATSNVTLTDKDKSRVLYLTTASATVESKTDDNAGGYTVVYKAKDGFKFTDKSVQLTDIADAKVTKTISPDGLTLTVKVAYQGTDLKDSFTVKVTGIACDERTITPPKNVQVAGVDANITLSKEKARKCDRVTITIAPKTKDGKEYEINEDNVKKALADGKLAMSWTDTNGTKKAISEYEIDKKGNLIFFFLMPDSNITLSIALPAAADKLPIFTEINREKQPTTPQGHGVGIGAAFSFAYTQFDTCAYIGENRHVTTGTFWLDAEGGLEVQTIAVSGTDPIGTKNKYYNTQDVPEDSVKKISVDAGVAFGYLGGSVKAFVESGAVITTTSDQTVNINKTKLSSDATEEQKKLSEQNANFAITVKEWSVTEARASAFTAGSTTAVGACVAVNYIDVASLAAFDGTGAIRGAAYIMATSQSKDIARGIATAMGADMDRYAKKFRKAGETTQEAANRVTNGEAFNGDKSSSKTETGKKISTKVEKAQSSDGKTSNGAAPISSQAARSQNAGGDAGEAIQKGNEAASKVGASNSNGQASASYQVAAAVALNITAHAATVWVGGDMRFHALYVLSTNNGNFSTLATGAAMSLSKSSNAVAAAVAVSLNKNAANVQIDDGVALTCNDNVRTAGDVRIEARTTQNLTDEFSRYMTAQSLAGAVSGEGGKATIAGAVSVVKAQAETETLIGDGVEIMANNVTIGAADKSRLTARAGAVSVSKGTSRGIGASFALVYAEDGILAEVGDNLHINCASYTLYAEKASVNASDYTALDWRFLFTNSSNLTDEQRERTQRGVVDVHKNKDTGGYSVDLNISTDTMLELIELCNFLSAVNYYVEAISGAITTGANTQMVASGSFALLFKNNSVQALMGDGVLVEGIGDANISASDSSRVRVIAGAVAAGPAADAGGLTVGFMKDSGTVCAKVGNGAGTTSITAASVSVTAANSADNLVITVAVASSKKDAVGGAVTVVLMQHSAKAEITDGVSIHATGSPDKSDEVSIQIAATTDMRLMLISASASLSGNVAVGGTVAAIYNEATAHTVLGENVRLTADAKAIRVTAASTGWMLNILASASAAIASGEGKSFAGAIGLLWDKSRTAVEIGDGVIITAGGDIAIRASVDSTMLNIFVGAAYGGGSAIGLTLLFNYLERTAKNQIGNRVGLTSQTGNISVDALGTEWTLIVGVAVGVSATQNVLAGTNGVTLSKSAAETLLGNGCTLLAGDSISLTSNLLIRSYQIVTGVALSGGGTAGVGETITVMTIENTIRTVVGDNAVMKANCLGNGLVTGNRSERRRGIYIGATATENLLIVSVSGSTGGKYAVSGVAHVLHERNKTEAKVSAGAKLTAENHSVIEPVDADGRTITADVKVEADDDSSIIDIAGGLSAATGAGFGATALALVFSKTVTADAGSAENIRASGSVSVTAAAVDTLALLALSFGFAKNVSLAGSANALLYENNVYASLGGAVQAGQDIFVTAASRETLVNIVVAVSVSSGAGIAAVAVLTFFESRTQTAIKNNASLTAGGNISVTSNSIEYISADVLGGAGGKAGIGGALNLIRTKLATNACTGTGVQLHAAGDIMVQANDDYKLLSVSGMVGVGTSVGVGAVVTLSLHYNSVDAGIGTGNTVTGRNLTLGALSKRDFQTFTMTIAGAGTAAVGAAVAVLLAGGNLVQDACNTVLGMEPVGGKNYYVYYTKNTGSKEALYRLDDKYYVRGSNDAMTEVAVTHVAGESGVTYDGKNYMPSAMNPKAQIEGIASKCNVDLGKAGDVNDTIKGDGNTSDKMGQGEYDRYANAETETRVKSGSDEPITDEQVTGTNIVLDPANSVNGTLLDGTKAHIDTGSTLRAIGSITVESRDLLLAIELAGAVSIGGTAGIGVGFAAAKLMSTVHATVAENVTMTADGSITVRAICGAENKEVTDTFCPVTNTMGCQKTANDNMPGVRTQLEKAGLIANSNQTGSLWLISIAAAGGGTAGVGVAGGVLLFYSDTKASFAGTVTKATNLLVETQLNYKDVLAVVISLGIGGVAGVGVTVAVVYLEGSLIAEIANTARISNVTGKISVVSTGASKLQTGAASLAIAGVAAVSANISVLLNKNRMVAAIQSGAVISAPQADILVHVAWKADTNAMLIAAAVGGTAGVAVSVLICIAELKIRAYTGVSPDATGDGAGGAITASSLSVSAEADQPVKSRIVNVAGGFVGVGAVLALSLNRIDNAASVSKVPLTLSGTAKIEAVLHGQTSSTTVTATGGFVAATLVIAVATVYTKNTARLNGGSAAVSASSLYVRAQTADSNVTTDIAAGASIALAAYSVYVSVAWNKAINYAVVETAGSIVLPGALTVLSEGGAQANATAKTYLDIAVVKLSSMVSVALIMADYSASLQLRSANVQAGAVTVRSTYAAQGEGAKAFAGGAGNLPQISGMALSFLGTYADSSVTNRAFVSGSGTLTGANLLVEANTNSRAGAYTRQVVVSLLTVAMVAAGATVCDSTTAFIGGVDASNALRVMLQSAATVRAESVATSVSESIAPVTVAVVSIGVGSVLARIGRSADKRHTVAAYIGNDVALTASEITVQASNNSTATARMKQGYTISAVDLRFSTVPTKQYTDVTAGARARSVLLATKGNIVIDAVDLASADALVDGLSIGVLVSADSKYAKNTVNQKATAELGEYVNLVAYKGITMRASADAKMRADTNSMQTGLFSIGVLQAHNELVRLVRVAILDGCNLGADFGDILVEAKGGAKDDIETLARGGGAGLVGIGSIESKTTVDSAVLTTLGRGVAITNTFHGVSVLAHVYENKVTSTGDYVVMGLIAAPEIRSFIAEVKLSAKVQMAESASIAARDITVESRMPSLHIAALSNAESYMFGGTTRAYSRITFHPTVETDIHGAVLCAYDKLSLLASANPDTYGTSLQVRAEGYSGAVISYTVAEAKLEGLSTTILKIGGHTELTGADVRARTEKFSGTVSLNAIAKKAALGWTRERTPNDLTHSDTKQVQTDTVFHIADAAAGIAIDYYQDADGQIVERTAGMPNESSGKGFAVITGTARISLANVRIENLLPGKLNTEGVDISACKIYGQNYIQRITITNHTDAELVLGAIDTYNEAFTRSAVTATAFSQANQHASPSDRPIVRVESTGKGNVRLMGKIINDRGTLTIAWTGNEHGSLYTNPSLYLESTRIAPVWTHALHIENAANMGESEDKPFEAYLTAMQTKDAHGNSIYESPTVAIRGVGAAFAKLSLTEIIAFNGDTLPDGMDQSEIHGAIDLGNCEANRLTIICGTPFRMYYLAKAETAVIVLPGVVEFTTETIVFHVPQDGNANDMMLSMDAIARYYIGKASAHASPTDSIKLNVYYLPNELVIYLVEGNSGLAYGYKPNELYKVTGTNTSFDTSKYRLQYAANGELNIVLRDNGDATLNLATGILTTGSTGISVFVSYDEKSGQWLLPEGAFIVDATLEELYTVQYTRDAIGRRVAQRDSNGNVVVALRTDLGDPRFSIGAGADCIQYFLLYEDGPSNTVYYMGLNLEDTFVNVFSVSAQDAWSSAGKKAGDEFNPTKLYVNIDDFMGIRGLHLWAYFWRDSYSHNRFRFEEHKLTYYNGDITANVLQNGKYYYIDHPSETFSDALTKYWYYWPEGGSTSKEHVHIDWFWLTNLTDKSKFSVVTPVMCEEKSTDAEGNTQIVQYKAYRYGSLTGNPLRYVNLLAYDLKRYYPTGTVGSGLDMTYVTDAAFGKIAMGFQYHYAGAYVAMPKGLSMRLYRIPANDKQAACYRIFENLWITTSGDIIGRKPIGTTGDFDIYTYCAADGLLKIERQTGADDNDRKLTFLLKREGGKQSMLIQGDIHLERYCRNVARDIMGRFFYLNGTKWEALSQITGSEAYKQGYVLTADGAEVYYANKKVFSIGKNKDGKVLHTIYKEEDGSLRYSVDEDGVVSWGYEINPAACRGYFGGSDSGSYIVNADATGVIRSGNFVVQAGAVLRVDAESNLQPGATGDVTLDSIELNGPDHERSPWLDRPVPAGKLVLDAKGNISIGSAIVKDSELALDSKQDLFIGRLTGTGSEIDLTANGALRLDEAYIEGGNGTALTGGAGVTIGAGSLVPNGSMSVDAGGDIRMEDVTLGGNDPVLVANGGIFADYLELVSEDGLQATANGDIDVRESDTTGSGPLRFRGDHVRLRDNLGDLQIAGIVAKGSITLVTEGSVLDVSGNATTPLITNLVNAQEAEDTSLRKLGTVQEALADAVRAENLAQQWVFEAQQALIRTDPKNAAAVRAAKARLEEAERALRNAKLYAAQMQSAVDAANVVVQQKHSVVEEARRRLNEDIGKDSATLKSGGDLFISATGDIGSGSLPMLTDTAGETTLLANGNTTLYSESDLTLAGVDGGSTTLVSARNIRQSADPDARITARDVTLTALIGSVGANGNPIRIDGEHRISASGNDVYVRSDGDLITGNMTAHGTMGNGVLPNGDLWLWAETYFFPESGTRLVYGHLFLHRLEPVLPPYDPTKPVRGGDATDARRAASGRWAHWTMLLDIPTGVSVEGYLTEDAMLTVTPVDAGQDVEWPTVNEPDCGACAVLRGALSLAGRIGGYVIRVSGERVGKLLISVPVGGNIADGTVITLLCCVDGELLLLTGEVTDGNITVAVDGQEITMLLFADVQALNTYLDGI